jgi:soluble lytic murein transglycosylase-like protein
MTPSPFILGLPLAVILALLFVSRPAEAAGRPFAKAKAADAIPDEVERLARKWGEIFGVPTAWIRSQAYAESRNIPYVVNPKTEASGIMQLLPKTAAWLHGSLIKSALIAVPEIQKTLAARWHGRQRDLLNPDLNILLATYYLMLLKRKFGDRHNIVAAAYNIGHGRIAYHLKHHLPLPKQSRLYLALVEDAKARGFA